jgi:hypothetical protein
VPVDFAQKGQILLIRLAQPGSKLHDQPCAIVAVNHGRIIFLSAVQGADGYQTG